MMITASFFLSHFFHFFYAPSGSPWYQGNVWGNIVCLSILAPGGYIWSKSKFWPLNPLRKGITHLHEKMDGLHDKHNLTHERLTAMEESLAHLHRKHDELHEKLDKPS